MVKQQRKQDCFSNFITVCSLHYSMFFLRLLMHLCNLAQIYRIIGIMFKLTDNIMCLLCFSIPLQENRKVRTIQKISRCCHPKQHEGTQEKSPSHNPEELQLRTSLPMKQTVCLFTQLRESPPLLRVPRQPLPLRGWPMPCQAR